MCSSDLRTGQSLRAVWDKGQVRVTMDKPTRPQVLHGVVLGFGLKTAVKRGENGGRNLEGNFVVLSHKQQRIAQGRPTPVTFSFNNRDLAKQASRYAFALWLTDANSPLPYAAAGNWLPKKPFQ
mgnify:CR=1 FL=1